MASLPLDVLAVYLGWNSGGICGIVKKILIGMLPDFRLYRGAREWEQIFQANYMTYIMEMYLKCIQNGRLLI